MSGRAAAALLVGLVLVLALAGTGAALLRGEDVPPRVVAPPLASLAPDARSADELARAACVRLRLAAQGIRAGAAADAVRRELAGARALSAAALRGDARYAPLSGGIAALDEAVRRNDPVAATEGLRTALASCDAAAG